MPKKSEPSIEEQYKKLTQYEHILSRPDTYVGSLEFQKERLWVFNSEENKLEFREVSYVPGLFKIFDEILVNAADNYQRDKSMKYIKVDINPEENRIRVKNGGKGIPIEIHKTYNMYVPQLIFGNLLTSSNYNDNIKKVTGGRNGYGAKLTNIFSKTFIVETANQDKGKKYRQKFYDNMLKFDDPEIKDYSGEDFTSITFEPDLSRFGMEKMDEDIIALFKKRVYDMAGITPKGVNVFLNGEKLQVDNFEKYINMYIQASKEEDLEDPPIVFEQPHERWEIAMSLSESQFQQVSFVNSISTYKGGTHVNYVTDKIVKSILEKLEKKNKQFTIKPQHVKQHLWIFVNSQIENPTFDSQTKETLTSKPSDFGSSFELSENFIKKVLKTNIVERCLRYAKTREDEKNLRKLNGKTKKTARLLGIEKLDDANWAGTKNSEKCTLILTEGDSAKSLAMAGIEVVGRDTFGCFPLRGKMLNVRECATQKIIKNQEVQYLMKILGIKIGENYTDLKNLRYGSILIMTDQDVDGSHIKGLIVNFIHTFWPSLIKINGFVRQFITPILKATKGSEVHSFYTIPEYKKWLDSKNGKIKGYKIKYYKGLGTSTNKEAQEYFSNIKRHRIDFEYTGQKDDESIDMAFNKKKTEERKNWLLNFDPNTPPLDLDIDKISYEKFINRELILFSMYDNQRSIPSLCDGLKPSERKILFGCFKRNLRDEIKVAQLTGYISEHSAYHHGEQSLSGTIVAMAQNFVGSNNINLLLPLGQFGTRNKGGKDSASARYIFTNLNKVTRHLFNSNDLPLMDYLVEEGQKIEPKYYLPIIPTVLVNGTEGIGTGWSSNIPCFNPREIVLSIKNKIKNNVFLKINPWYKGFQGEIKEDPKKEGTFIVRGKYHWSEEDPSTVIIDEIPIKKWTDDYKIFLQELMGVESLNSEDKNKDKKKGNNKEEEEKKKKKKEIIVEDIRQNHTYNRVCFEVKLIDNFVDKFKKNSELFIKTFNLESSLSITNMVLFDPEGKLKKYNTVEEIMSTFYDLRLKYYQIRKDYMISVIKKDVAILSNKARFIKMMVEDELVIKKKMRNVIVNELYELKFDTQTTLDNIRIKSKSEQDAEIELINQNLQNENDEEKKEESDSEKKEKKGKVKSIVPWKEYDYLLSMNFWNITYEKVEELLKQKEMKEKELEELKNTTIETLWIKDLDNFLEELDKYEQQEEEDRLVAEKLNKNKEGKVDKKKKRKKADKNKLDSSMSSINESDNSVISSGEGKKLRKKKDSNAKDKSKEKIKDKNKNKDNGKENVNSNDGSSNGNEDDIYKKNALKKKMSKIIMEDSDEEDISVKKISSNSNGKDTYNTNNSENGTSSNNDSTFGNKSIFKVPLMERLKKRNVKINDMPGFQFTSFGKKAKREFDEFSDIEFDFNDKDKFF